MTMSRFATVSMATLLLAACDSPEGPPPTRQEVLEACIEYADATCRAFATCLGWTQDELDDCVDEERGDCPATIGGESCTSRQLDAYVGCTADVEGEACDDLCSENGCFASCSVFCPAQ
jgi:hypothetical protein